MLYELEIFWLYLQMVVETISMNYNLWLNMQATWFLVLGHAIIILLLVAVLYFAVVGINKKIGDIKNE